jgi:hypothetical protein
MLLFLMFLLGLNFFTTSIKTSLIRRKAHSLALCLIFGNCAWLLFPFSLKINCGHIMNTIASPGAISLVCTFQIIDSAVVMLLAAGLIRTHYFPGTKNLWRSLSRLPSILFIPGLFLAQSSLFHVLSGWNYFMLALLNSAGAALLLIVSDASIRWLLASWENRLEFLITLSFLQVVVSMFLPIVAGGIRIEESSMTVCPVLTSCVLVSMMLAAAAGYWLRRLRRERMK